MCLSVMATTGSLDARAAQPRGFFLLALAPLGLDRGDLFVVEVAVGLGRHVELQLVVGAALVPA